MFDNLNQPNLKRRLHRLFVRMNQALYVCLTNQRRALFWVLFVSLSSGWAITTGRLLFPMGNKRKGSFSRTLRRSASLGIEPGVINLSAGFILYSGYACLTFNRQLQFVLWLDLNLAVDKETMKVIIMFF